MADEIGSTMKLSMSELKNVVAAPMLDIAVQGGKLTLSPEGAACLVFGIWIKNSNGWFEFVGVELGARYYYELGISVEKCEPSPLVNQSKLSQPPFAPVKEFPTFCQLDLLKIGSTKRIKISVQHKALSEQLDLIKSLHFHCDQAVFEFVASEKYPENIEIRQSLI